MISYRSGPLSVATEDWLRLRQGLVNAEPDRQTRYARARQLFSDKRGRQFDEIRQRLAAMSPPGSACFYCERDRYRDVDHIRPIRHYPETCFDWQNYVYACAICNQDAKNDRYGIVADDGGVTEIDRTWPADRTIPAGTHAVIDVRSEDPFDFLLLDLETGRFVASGVDAVTRARGQFTRDLLRLDSDDLSRMRRQAREFFINYLTKYAEAHSAGQDAIAQRILGEIRELPHPTVLAELRRQAKAHPQVATLIDLLPSDVGTPRRGGPT